MNVVQYTLTLILDVAVAVAFPTFQKNMQVLHALITVGTRMTLQFWVMKNILHDFKSKPN
jgi:hypothetical protein